MPTKSELQVPCNPADITFIPKSSNGKYLLDLVALHLYQTHISIDPVSPLRIKRATETKCGVPRRSRAVCGRRETCVFYARAEHPRRLRRSTWKSVARASSFATRCDNSPKNRETFLQ